MSSLVFDWIITPICCLVFLFGILWALANPIIIILTTVVAFIIFVILKRFLSDLKPVQVSRHNRCELHRIGMLRSSGR